MLRIYLVGLVRYGTPPSSDRKKQNHWTLTTNDIWVNIISRMQVSLGYTGKV